MSISLSTSRSMGIEELAHSSERWRRCMYRCFPGPIQTSENWWRRTHVVVCAARGLIKAHGQRQRRSIQRLKGLLLIGTQHKRTIWRCKIQPDDVPHLFNSGGACDR